MNHRHARRFPTNEQLAQVRDNAASIEAGMSDAGKATHTKGGAVLHLQFDDTDPVLVQAADDLCAALDRTGRFTFGVQWDAGRELVEVFEKA